MKRANALVAFLWLLASFAEKPKYNQNEQGVYVLDDHEPDSHYRPNIIIRFANGIVHFTKMLFTETYNFFESLFETKMKCNDWKTEHKCTTRKKDTLAMTRDKCAKWCETQSSVGCCQYNDDINVCVVSPLANQDHVPQPQPYAMIQSTLCLPRQKPEDSRTYCATKLNWVAGYACVNDGASIVQQSGTHEDCMNYCTMFTVPSRSCCSFDGYTGECLATRKIHQYAQKKRSSFACAVFPGWRDKDVMVQESIVPAESQATPDFRASPKSEVKKPSETTGTGVVVREEKVMKNGEDLEKLYDDAVAKIPEDEIEAARQKEKQETEDKEAKPEQGEQEGGAPETGPEDVEQAEGSDETEVAEKEADEKAEKAGDQQAATETGTGDEEKKGANGQDEKEVAEKGADEKTEKKEGDQQAAAETGTGEDVDKIPVNGVETEDKGAKLEQGGGSDKKESQVKKEDTKGGARSEAQQVTTKVPETGETNAAKADTNVKPAKKRVLANITASALHFNQNTFQ